MVAETYSYITNAHPSFIENLYEQYKNAPDSIDASWVNFFRGFEYNEKSPELLATSAAPLSENGVSLVAHIPQKEIAVASLIDGYRHRGHLLSQTNPLKPRRDRKAHLDLSDFGLQNDGNTVFVAGELIGLKNATLNTIETTLKKLYAGTIGFEYSHIDNEEKRKWLRDRIEHRTLEDGFGFTIDKKRRILHKLNESVGFEEFLGKKFVGKKRFSLEGGESTIAAIDAIINTSVDAGVEECIIGMAHRGRLNALVNIMQKTPDQIFEEFEENVKALNYGSGDVKYHLGYSSQALTANGKSVYLKLPPNPSHLEAIDPVMLGFSRAKADILYKSDFDKILPIMVHGDAAVAGQGIVYEVIQMSQLPGYYTGGTIHFVINNQIGFTTDFDDARSSTYCSSVASVVQAPTFHVNGDDPEAVVFVSELATAYRQEFNNDVFIDMVCYRRHGHNESDNPEFTQPRMWALIKNHTNVRELYIKQLETRSEVTKIMAEEMKKQYDDALQLLLAETKQNAKPYKFQEPEIAWRNLKRGENITDGEHVNSPITGVSAETIQKVLEHLMRVPNGFTPLKDILRYLDGKQKLITNNIIDWGYGELLAYATLLLEKHDVRLSGEDVKRGTFSHRHACFFDADTDKEFNRLNNISENQNRFLIYNSLLSEYGVMGFEFGYSMATPDTLVVWEAQFGDFHNGAQTIIDQFIAAGESKWQRQNGLVLLLPHGYEGQGPEHSSGRVERFLQLCAENNMIVANVTTPANFFHLIRRQLVRNFRKPLVIMTPKSLLRHPDCISSISDFIGDTKFEEIIDDVLFTDIKAAKKVERVLFCTGKIYFDLLAQQRKQPDGTVALVRVEQIYPFAEQKAMDILSKYKNAKAFWIQEEPQNMGAWSFLSTFHSNLGLKFIGRKAAASPATGYAKTHAKEQNSIVMDAFGAAILV